MLPWLLPLISAAAWLIDADGDGGAVNPTPGGNGRSVSAGEAFVATAIGAGLMTALMLWEIPYRVEWGRDQILRVRWIHRDAVIPLRDVTALVYSTWMRSHVLRTPRHRVDLGAHHALDLRALAHTLREVSPAATVSAPLPSPEPLSEHTIQRLSPVAGEGGRITCPACSHGVRMHPQPWRSDWTRCAQCLIEQQRGSRGEAQICRERYPH
jgi:hypothetical protein